MAFILMFFIYLGLILDTGVNLEKMYVQLSVHEMFVG